jgi:iron complex outermembrane recepter protein
MKNQTSNHHRLHRLRLAVMASTLASTVGAGFTSTAFAAEGELEEVIVTGSRIVRRDFQSNSPIVTVNADDFETQSGLNVESYLNQLPTYNPAASPTTTQADVQISPVNSVGVASISLRGFGANRSLVLINGKRPTPINALMVTDVNGVPSALLQRVETITGGASAVYGADAVAGVTNFILRDNFEGFEVDAQYGVAEVGDGDESRISAVLGSNFADGRGNATFGVERYSRKTAFENEREIFVKDRWENLYAGGGGIRLQGVNSYVCNSGYIALGHGSCPHINTINALFANRPAGTNVISPLGLPATGVPNGGTFDFNPNSTIYVNSTAGGMSKYTGPVNSGEYYTQRLLDPARPPASIEFDSIKWVNTQALASAPQERYSFFSSGSFDITDTINVYARTNFAESKTRTLLGGTSVINGWEVSLPYDPTRDSPVNPALNYRDASVVAAILANPAAYANPGFIDTGKAGAHFPVPLEMAILLNSRNNPSGMWQPSWATGSSVPPRNTYNTNEVWQVEVGVNFELPFRDWTGEYYMSHGESSTYNLGGGNFSLERTRRLLNQPDYGRNAKGTGNFSYVGADGQTVRATRPNFGSGDYTCTSGFYDTLFKGDKPMSADCFAAINADLQARTQNEQDIIELNLQGSLMELPAGEMRMAGGYQHRENSSQFYPDGLQSTNSFTDQVIGLYPTGKLDASAKVDDFYLEALVPVLKDLPFMQELELELGARYSEYEHTDAETTWKALVNWGVNDIVRLRGGFNRATRAPNLGELFLAQQELFTAAGNFGDSCGLRSNAPFGAGGVLPDPILNPGEPQTSTAPGQTAAAAQSTYLICQEMMGGAGSPAATRFYTVSDAIGATGGGFAFVQQKGNPNLTSETADTWTLGAVISSPWENPWLSGLTATVDWYSYEIQDAILLYSLDYANFRCFGQNQVSSAAQAKTIAQSDACQLLPRDQVSGTALNTAVSYDNQATIETRGYDVGVNWSGDLAELVGLSGRLALSMQATVLDYYKTKQSPATYDPEIDWAGSLGPTLVSTNGGAFDYRLFANASYMKDDWSVSLRWRYLPEVWSAGYAQTQALIKNNQAVKAGGAGILLGYTPPTEIKTSDYSIFDFSFNWNMNETLALRGGITNLLDTKPELTGRTRGWKPGTTLVGQCAGAPGCQDPTAFSLPGVGTYSPGYYDTIGRRFFVGVKASF